VNWAVAAVLVLLGVGFLALSLPIIRAGAFPGWIARRPALMWPLKKTDSRIARLQGWAGIGVAVLLLGVALLAVLPFSPALGLVVSLSVLAVAVLTLVVWVWSVVHSRA
jgi:hypothetical protein